MHARQGGAPLTSSTMSTSAAASDSGRSLGESLRHVPRLLSLRREWGLAVVAAAAIVITAAEDVGVVKAVEKGRDEMEEEHVVERSCR